MKAFRILLAWLLIVSTAAPAAVINGELKSALLEKLSSDPSSTVSGRVYYNTTTNGAKLYNGSAWGSLGGSGGGEKNYISAGTSSATGWAASGAGLSTPATDSTPADLPEPTVATALKLTGASGSSAYAFYPFTLDPSDYSRKLKVSFAQACGLVGAASTIANCAASDFKVDVYSCTVAWSGSPATTCSGTSARLALSTDSSAVSALPALTGTYRTTFDSPGSAAPYLMLRIGMNTTQTHAIALSSIVVGPGVVTQGAVTTAWSSYTPTMSNDTAIAASVSQWYWRRVGDSMEIVFLYTTFGGDGSSASSWGFSLPTGYTQAIPNASNNPMVGQAQIRRVGGSTTPIAHLDWINANSVISLIVGDAAPGAAVGTGFGTSATRISAVHGRLTVPIAEWAGNGTVNVISSGTEYACNSSTNNADDTTSFSYGPAGCQFVNFSAADRNKTVRFATPIQKTDQVVLKVSLDSGVTWTQPGFSSAIDSYHSQNSVAYGMQYNNSTATDVIVTFAPTRRNVSASWGGVGTDWSAVAATSTAVWRMEKTAGGNGAIGFANVTQAGAGLVQSAGQLLGTNTNDSATAGNVGEYVSNVRSSGTPAETVANTANFFSIDSGNSTYNDGAETGITLTAGEWDVQGHAVCTGASGANVNEMITGIGTAKGNSSAGLVLEANEGRMGTSGCAACLTTLDTPLWRVNLSATTTYYLKERVTFTVGASTVSCVGSIRARRVR